MALWFAEIDADGTEPEERKRNMELLGKLAEYKPLAKIEKMEEQNYNMVDNVLNNGTGEKAQKEENKKAQVAGQSREQSVTLEGGQMAKLLRYIVHTLEIFMWEQDYCLNHDEEDYDPFLDGEEDFLMEDLEDRLEIQPPKEPEGSPSWWVQVEYANHTEQDICSYNDYLPDRPEELYLSLVEYFEPEEEGFWFLFHEKQER